VDGQRLGEAFPWGTPLINIVSSFVIGLFFSVATVESRCRPASMFGYS
jgi:fluoride ion exporter CrcB/FEX